MDYSKIYLGLFNSEKIMLGSTRIEKAYLGTTLILNYEHNYSNDYLTFKITSDGTIKWVASNTDITRQISYSKDNGTTWNDIVSTTGGTSISVVSGDKVMFKSNNGNFSNADTVYNSFKGTTASFEVEGNIMSLLYGDNFSGQTSLRNDFTFNSLFMDCTTLTSAENLILPATSIRTKCYQLMFKDCTNLIKSPTILPATTLLNFCYQQMFRNCSNLTTTPELPATSLKSGCYNYLFTDCSKVNYIKCMATSNRGNGYTTSWVSGVASTGTFVKNPSASTWGTSVNFCPPGWTQINAS